MDYSRKTPSNQDLSINPSERPFRPGYSETKIESQRLRSAKFDDLFNRAILRPKLQRLRFSKFDLCRHLPLTIWNFPMTIFVSLGPA